MKIGRLEFDIFGPAPTDDAIDLEKEIQQRDAYVYYRRLFLSALVTMILFVLLVIPFVVFNAFFSNPVLFLGYLGLIFVLMSSLSIFVLKTRTRHDTSKRNYFRLLDAEFEDLSDITDFCVSDETVRRYFACVKQSGRNELLVVEASMIKGLMKEKAKEAFYDSLNAATRDAHQ